MIILSYHKTPPLARWDRDFIIFSSQAGRRTVNHVSLKTIS
ncbi:hypothetical protein MWLf4_1089 [Limosilactobacillus fermentum]|nr:hypothetical protein MWLf4_1089 [Limosilactobacillus fermentum]